MRCDLAPAAMRCLGGGPQFVHRVLRRARLVAVRPGPDRRVKLAGITEAGRQALAQAMPLWREAQRQVVEGTGSGRWDALRRELGRITELAGDDAPDAPEPPRRTRKRRTA